MLALDSLKCNTGKEEAALKLLVLLLPVMMLFGIHIKFFKIAGIGYITLPRIYWTVMAVVTVIYILKRLRHGTPGFYFGHCARYVAIMLAIGLYSCVSLAAAINYHDSLDKVMFQLSGIAAVFYIAAFTSDGGELAKFLRVLTVCFAVTAAIGVFEIYTKIYIFSPGKAMLTKTSIYGRSYPCAVFYDTNDLATFLTLFLPFAVFTVSDWIKGAAGKLVCFLLSALVFMDLLGGRARISFFVLTAIILGLIIIFVLIRELRTYLKEALFTAAGLPAAAFILKLTELKKGSVAEKISTINTHDYSVNERFTITKSGIKMAFSHIFTGVGVGNSIPLLPRYEKVREINLHNTPLQILAEYGIFIFAAYAAGVVMLALDFAKRPGGPSKRRVMAFLCFITLLAFQFESAQPSDTLHISAVYMLPGVLFAADKIFYTRKHGGRFAQEKHIDGECS